MFRGLGGDLLNADIASGSWRTHTYEVSRQETPANANWFTIEEFRGRLRTTSPPRGRVLCEIP